MVGCSGAELGRFVAMLRNGSAVLRTCAAFALLQVITGADRQDRVDGAMGWLYHF